ncbi:unnamed protein product [Toxocara canis]|uniref:Uncharacterized protein n=1 Tax=Toxocara canis TaxID=6265 RepID=A0A3P7IAY9_TOXCA|nr:unnamed protein product [Toxocara canis]
MQATKTITKPKGKRGRPVGSTKKGKKRGAAAKVVKKNTKKESGSEHEESGNEADSGADAGTHEVFLMGLISFIHIFMFVVTQM